MQKQNNRKIGFLEIKKMNVSLVKNIINDKTTVQLLSAAIVVCFVNFAFR